MTAARLDDPWLESLVASARVEPTPIHDATLRLYQTSGEHTYTCVGCSTDTDPDLDPSPGEADEFCAACWTKDHPDGAA